MTQPTPEQLRLARECAVTAAHSARFDDEILSFWVTAWSDRAKGIFEEGATQSALLAIQATEARMAAAVEAETGWLIEVPANEHNPIIYYCGKGTYNADASKAVRFCRKQDAEAVMADMGTEKSIATEHRWG